MASYDNKVLTGDQLVYFSSLVKSALANKADASAVSGKQDALVFNTAYNASTNKVATMADMPIVDVVENVNVNQDKSIITLGNKTITVDNFESGLVLEVDEETGNGRLICSLEIPTGFGVENISTGELDSNDEEIMLDTKLNTMDTAISGKQDALVFNTAYNASSNKVATMSDITNALSGVGSFSFEIVQSLPQSNISTSKIYLVAKGTAGTNQVYTEYAYVNNAWEIIGDTSMSIDTLSNAEVQTIWNTASAS